VRPLTPPRRIAVAAASLCCCALLFRGNVATALVSRGDALLTAGDLSGAVRLYDRALRIDRTDADAADRLAFAFLLRRDPGDAQRAYAAAVTGLLAAPQDGRLLVDRGFASQRLSRWHDAQAAFLRAAAVTHDARYAHLAARMASRVRP
jgi:tetratricopeptide (TPR) repeat protein